MGYSPEIRAVEITELQGLMDLAREGWNQQVPYSGEPEDMASAAAMLSKEKCGKIIEKLRELGVE